MPKNNDTSWQNVAGWYNKLLQGNDTYQAQVIAPNILRILDPKSSMLPKQRILDIACGQGFFSELLTRAGAQVTGIDLAPELITLAQRHALTEKLPIEYFVAPADHISICKDSSYDKALMILALQNVKNGKGVFDEAFRVLVTGGTFTIVLNHPAFRIPQGSGWDWKEGKQYRVIEQYLSERTISIDMHPGAKDSPETISFHRPLQWYIKHAVAAGFVLTRFEEWISHKESQNGPRKSEEDRMRKEIPLFACLEFRK